MRMLNKTAALLAAICLGACVTTHPERPVATGSETFRPGSIWRQVPAVIALLDGTGQLTRDVHAPPRVRAGQPLMVDVTSYGGGCESQGTGQVSVEGMEADIRVFDYTDVSPPTPGFEHVDRICTTGLKVFRKRFAVQFQRSGDALVRVHGVRRAAGQLDTTTEVLEFRVRVD
ncbi:MAG: hypothetical protein Q4F49_06385 [Pseudoxanthomonas suwonensis]|nr:hypothetical protein [Pseudoxanthomonas suwonensis]